MNAVTNNSQLKYKVCVWCNTYNQASYIKDTMNGFCMQQTSFPFVCLIMDDASTDVCGLSAEIQSLQHQETKTEILSGSDG